MSRWATLRLRFKRRATSRSSRSFDSPGSTFNRSVPNFYPESAESFPRHSPCSAPRASTNSSRPVTPSTAVTRQPDTPNHRARKCAASALAFPFAGGTATFILSAISAKGPSSEVLPAPGGMRGLNGKPCLEWWSVLSTPPAQKATGARRAILVLVVLRRTVVFAS